VINSIRSERGWWDRRRIVVFVSVVAAFGVFTLSSAGTAEAGFTTCKGSVAAKSKGKPGKAAKVSFSCSDQIRAYGIASNKAISSFSNPPLVNGSPVSFFQCSTASGSAGFGCGVVDRAAPGIQNLNQGNGTGSGGASGGGDTCNRSADIDPAPSPATNTQIVGPPCTQVIPAGAVLSQDVTLAANPCKFKPKDPLQMTVVVGGEPVIATFNATYGDQHANGEYVSEPFKLKAKGYSGCQPEAPKKGKKATGAAAQTAATGGLPINPVQCGGTVEPKVPGKPDVDAKYHFVCDANIRTYAIVTNKPIDLVGGEAEVKGPGTNSVPCVGVTGPPAIPAPPPIACAELESAAHQCEGPIPYIGFGCGFPDRQATASTNNTYGRRLSAGNTLSGEIGFPVSPCKREPGTPKLKVWILAMSELTIQPPVNGAAGPTTGEFISEPFQLALTGYGKKACAPKKKKGGGK
jgi:hypothetical protein